VKREDSAASCMDILASNINLGFLFWITLVLTSLKSNADSGDNFEVIVECLWQI
jgi:hypothetical protein